MGKLHKAIPLQAFKLLWFLIVIPGLAIIIVLATIYRQLVCFCLSIKYRDDFFGLAALSDAFHEINCKTNLNIHSCLIIKTHQDFEDFFERIKNTLIEKSSHEYFNKISCLRRRFLGIDFLVKDEFRIDETLKVLKVSSEDPFIEKTGLEELITDYAVKDLQNQRFLEIQVVNKRVKLSDCDDRNNHFALLIKMQHSLCDYLHFVKFLGFLSDQSDFELLDKVTRKKIGFFEMLKKSADYALDSITNSINIDSNKLKNSQNCKSIYKLKMENSEEFVPLVKRIRKSVSGVKISDILLTGISASLSEFFEEKKVSLENFRAALPIAFRIDNSVILGNEVSSGRRTLPLKSNQKQSVLEKLKIVRRQSELEEKVAQPEGTWFCVEGIVLLLPPCLRTLLLDNISLADCIVSLVPTFNKPLKIFGGELENIIGYPPRLPKTRISAMLITYRDRFQFGLSIDETLIENEETEEILNGIFKYLLKLNEEINNNSFKSKN